MTPQIDEVWELSCAPGDLFLVVEHPCDGLEFHLIGAKGTPISIAATGKRIGRICRDVSELKPGYRFRTLEKLNFADPGDYVVSHFVNEAVRTETGQIFGEVLTRGSVVILDPPEATNQVSDKNESSLASFLSDEDRVQIAKRVAWNEAAIKEAKRRFDEKLDADYRLFAGELPPGHPQALPSVPENWPRFKCHTFEGPPPEPPKWKCAVKGCENPQSPNPEWYVCSAHRDPATALFTEKKSDREYHERERKHIDAIKKQMRQTSSGMICGFTNTVGGPVKVRR